MQKVSDFCESINLFGSREEFFLHEYSQTSLKMNIGVRIKIYSSVLEIFEDSPPLNTIVRLYTTEVIQN